MYAYMYSQTYEYNNHTSTQGADQKWLLNFSIENENEVVSVERWIIQTNKKVVGDPFGCMVVDCCGQVVIVEMWSQGQVQL